jgi:hypothetical protein
MRKLTHLLTAAAVLALAACGGGGSEDTLSGGGTGTGGGGGGGGTPPPAGSEIASLDLLTSTPQLPSDGSQTAVITALVRDANNTVVEGVGIQFRADSGSLTAPAGATTDATGRVDAELAVGVDKTNRPITITAEAFGSTTTLTATVTVNVIGTSISITGPQSLAANDTGQYTVVLTDAGGNGIGNQPIDVEANNLPAETLTTDSNGQVQVSLTASQAGSDTLTASWQPDPDAPVLTSTLDFTVADDTFAITAPGADAEIPLNTPETVTVAWSQSGSPVVGQTVNFATTRGSLSATSAVTDAAGEASVTVEATNAGAAVVTASVANGPSTQLPVEFVAEIAAGIEVQASPFTVGPSEQSTITATVRDAAGNLVKNKVVVFQLDDVTGGTLSVAQATTNSQGRAQTFYTAGTVTSATDGVVITATVQDTPAVTDTVALTVAQRQVFISLGTGNEIFEPNTSSYRKEFTVLVTDGTGAGVEGAVVQVSILSQNYRKGFWTLPPTGPWAQTINATCDDEDVNRNGRLDPGEDFNGSGRIEAGNVASAAVQPAFRDANGNLVTDAAGTGVVDVVYPQDHAQWVRVALEARTSVQGTEFARTSTFWLPILADDVTNRDSSPPGIESPFGVSANCGDTL